MSELKPCCNSGCGDYEMEDEMSEQYRCKSCGYVFDMKDMMCSECGIGYLERLRWTKGGDGSHWEGCEDVHWDCKIAQLEAELARLRQQTIDYENDIFLGQPIEYWIRIKAQLDTDMSDQWVREILLLKSKIERLQEERRWIPVSERLPGYDCTVLALLDDHTIIMCCYTTNGVGAFFDPDVRAVSDNFIEHPSHWMPLPKPPEGCEGCCEIDDATDRTCPDCGGAGELAGDYFSSDGMFSCGRCQGRGTL